MKLGYILKYLLIIFIALAIFQFGRWYHANVDVPAIAKCHDRAKTDRFLSEAKPKKKRSK